MKGVPSHSPTSKIAAALGCWIAAAARPSRSKRCAPGSFAVASDSASARRTLSATVRSRCVSSNEVIGRSVFDLYADSPRVLENVRGALAGEMLASVSEVSGLCYEVHYVPLRDAAGAVTGVLGLASDITERKLASDLLEKL